MHKWVPGTPNLIVVKNRLQVHWGHKGQMGWLLRAARPTAHKMQSSAADLLLLDSDEYIGHVEEDAWPGASKRTGGAEAEKRSKLSLVCPGSRKIPRRAGGGRVRRLRH